MTDDSPVQLGALVPLSRPGWVEAGQHLLADGAVLAEVLRSQGADRARTTESWPRVAVDGTRGQIRFSRTPGINVWQWAWAPVQVVDRDPARPDRFRILRAC